MDDVACGRSGCDAERWRLHSAMTINVVCDTGAESDVYECLVYVLMSAGTNIQFSNLLSLFVF